MTRPVENEEDFLEKRAVEHEIQVISESTLPNLCMYRNSVMENEEIKQQVFGILEEHQLRLNRKKCEFGKQTLIYLGFIVGGGELRVDPAKVKVIIEWPHPRSACQYLRKFIQNFSLLASPLHSLTKANQAFVWTNEHEDTFLLLKRKISEAPVLALPDLQKPFEIEIKGYITICKWGLF
ncbi:hypothetical protein NC653_018741 [Populus alba x Populus x berolinensis]|uniref:Reverse transcriptase/retrotransposon-derived protein RNase H-like domain-containing protein n=1 Tax=Populus alba x Populus x berolinensis TaxID=444605 RepID=A0AAD6QH27_9ROSI|nr:hypothetical protein NC653_018741 [Populus alba x Populus x berolinensis]